MCSIHLFSSLVLNVPCQAISSGSHQVTVGILGWTVLGYVEMAHTLQYRPLGIPVHYITF